MPENELDDTQKSTDSVRDQLEALEIPPNIDPRLLALWLEREREEMEASDAPRRRKARHGRSLPAVFAAYLGIVAMCVVILLGWTQNKEIAEILNECCWAILIYGMIGLFAGFIVEYCVRDSVETLLREIVRRSDEAAAAASETERS